MNTTLVIIGPAVILTGLFISVYGEVKGLRKMAGKIDLVQRVLLHVCAALLIGFGGLVTRMGLPNMRVICVERLLIMTLVLVLVAISFSLIRNKSRF